MKKKFALYPKFEKDFAYVVLVNGFVITICHDYSDAVYVADSYREKLPRPDVKVRGAIVKDGKVFMY